MIMLQSVVTVALLHWIVLVVPGPNVLIVCSLAARGERRSALCAGLGISVVAVVWASIAALGLGAVVAANAAARLALQFAGGCYLVYVAWRLSRARTTQAGELRPYTPAQAFRLGVTTNLLNPKSTLFFASVFVAALPVNASAPSILAAVGVVAINTVVWHTGLALLLSGRRAQEHYLKKATLVDRILAVILAALGLKLVSATALEALRSLP